MKLTLRLLLLLNVAVGLGLLLKYSDGTVTIVLPPNQYELAANKLLLGLIAIFIVLYAVLRLVSRTLSVPSFFRSRRERKNAARASAALNDAVLAMSEGRFQRAEGLAKKAQAHELTAGPAALIGARAAHQAGNAASRDRWLALVKEKPELDGGRMMLLAEGALDEGRVQDALASLRLAELQGALSDHGLQLRLRAQETAGHWRELLSTVDSLHSRGALGEETARSMRANAFAALFEACETDTNQVRALFQSLSRRDRKIDEVIEAAAQAFARCGEEERAAKMIEQVLAARLSAPMLVLYTRLETIPPRDRLRVAERWMSIHDEHELIMATLGRLCIAEGLWGKAEEFLKRANDKSPSPYTRLALAEMYEALGRGEEASGLYRVIAREQRLALAGGASA